MLTVHQIQRQRSNLRPPTRRRPCRRGEHASCLEPTPATTTFHNMLSHVHARGDQINDLADLGSNHDRFVQTAPAPAATHRHMRCRFVRVTPTKMRTRRAWLLPRLTPNNACFGSTFRPFLTRTNPIRRRRLRTIQRILPNRLLKHRNPFLQQRHHRLQRHNQRRLLNNHRSRYSARVLSVTHPSNQASREEWWTHLNSYLALMVFHGA